MSKKKLLFVMPDLGAGGGEKALVNLLHVLDESYFDIDLLLFKKEGLFLKQVPSYVNIITPQGKYDNFTKPILSSIRSLLSSKSFELIGARIKYAFVLRKVKNTNEAEQFAWKYWAKSMPNLDVYYDVAIGYLEKSSIYYVVDKVKSRKKIGFIHNDYSKLGLDTMFDKIYFEQLDRIVSVSKSCCGVLKSRFPDQTTKVRLMENVIAASLIHKLCESKPNPFRKKNAVDCVDILSIGRLSDQKGFDLGIKAIANLDEETKTKIRWYIIGAGDKELELKKLINDNNLQDIVVLLGLQENPYIWLKYCDFYFQPSRFEGKSIALDEALTLKKPILVTNFSSVKDQIIHDETGWIVDMDIISIKEGLNKLIRDEIFRSKLTGNLFKSKNNQISYQQLFESVIYN